MDEDQKMMMDIFDTSDNEPEDETTLVDVDKIMCFDVNSIESHILAILVIKAIAAFKFLVMGGYNENLTNTVKWLHFNDLDIIEDNNTKICLCHHLFQMPYTFANSEIPNNFRIKRPDSSTQQITPKNHLLLYTIAHIFDCTIFVFSARGKPCRILPIDKSLSGMCDKPAFVILQHCNSYLPNNSKWFPIKLYSSKTTSSSNSSSTNTSSTSSSSIMNNDDD
jgi:hypothetical protein